MSFAAHALTLRSAVLLMIPPLLWAGNAIVGRMVHDIVPPMTLNFLRWLLAFLLLLPFAYNVLRRSSPLWTHWKQYAWVSLLGLGCYNSFQYLALQTSTPINVTLVASSTPVFMLAIGALFFKQSVRKAQILGALMSIIGVMLVLCRGDWQALLQVRLVLGDVFVLLATACWAGYSWLLAQITEPAEVRNNWAYLLMAQITLGLGWSSLFTAGEWALTDAHIDLGWPLATALLFVALGPALLAYRCWTLGVQQVGPSIAGFFSNLTPLFAALLSTLILGEWPAWYHMVAFALIVGGIMVSARR
jgi:drug/metabolite transporter (DMT)-like permease